MSEMNVVIYIPILEEYNEVEMLMSDRFYKAKHRIISLTIANHKNIRNYKRTRFQIPSGISLDPQTKYYTVRNWNWTDIRMTHKLIEQKRGLEELNHFLKTSHPSEEFYVIKMLTETVVDGVRHICTWVRKKSAANQGNILSLQLRYIDGKIAFKHFTTDEMKHIVGRLTPQVCKLNISTSTKLVPLCDPAPAA